ncbi:NTP-binding protein [Streptomyces noursei ZPM]|uniref:ATP-binding protein n=2 Tax=Streptomyces TaxID=1883 RepID=A0A401R5J6_STRNR|nr:phage/plasmid primase, P4 family [Streptomyces noursei]AKA05394.1 NTP-binding protein [Streptomyces noursei ZPM]EXU86837.1 NTP-binding protein [Streptomyces noursei PD-1]UWS73788.1 phage/plasmid primase, P4 family [Streptomyces noursei]GCB92873.1 ATP-binding protein [Streptomyces noursei]
MSADAAEEIPPPSNPMAVARHLVADWQDADERLVRRRWRGSWMQWTGVNWRELEEVQVRAELYERLEHAVYCAGLTKDNEPDLQPWAPTKPKLTNLLDAVGAIMLLPSDVDTPSWIGRDEDDGPVVACENGVLRVRDRELLPVTPEFFNLVNVPFPYDAQATAPEWDAFLKKIWPEDPQAIEALRQWFGYVLSGRTDQQKILMLPGPSRSGKGTIARVLKLLVGAGNIAGPTLASMGSNFGLSTLVGKPLAVVSDARLSGRDNTPVVERLLTISGEDTIDIDRKFRDPWTGKLPTRLMILSNELPEFGDASGVIAQRFIVLRLTKSWLGEEDHGLMDRLTAEMSGILNWALDGLVRLEEQGRITEPASSRESVLTMQDTASPTSAFLRECCTTGPEDSVPVNTLWDAWKEWAEDNGHKPGSKQTFGRNLLSVVPHLHRSRPRDGAGRQVAIYTGITLTEDREAPTLGSPSVPAAPEAGVSGPNVGPCTRCTTPTVRYGPYGNPRCRDCR